MVQHGSGTAADGDTPLYILALRRETRQLDGCGNGENGGATVSHRPVSQVSVYMEQCVD